MLPDPSIDQVLHMLAQTQALLANALVDQRERAIA